MSNIFGIKDAANLIIKKKANNEIFLYADYATVTTNEWSAENVYARSKDVNAIRWDYGRTGTLTLTFEIFDLKVLSMMTGTEFLSHPDATSHTETKTVTSSVIVLTNQPDIGSLKVWKTETSGDVLFHEGDITTETNAYTIDYSTKTLTFHSSIADSTSFRIVFTTTPAGARSDDIFTREVLTVTSGAATMTGTATALGVRIYKVDSDGFTNTSELIKVTGTPATGQYAISGQTITFYSGDFASSDPKKNQIAVYYAKQVAGTKVWHIDANKYSENFQVYADTKIRDTSGTDLFVQINFLNCKPQANFTITMDASAITTLEIPFDLFKDTDSTDMAIYTIYE